MCEFLKIPFKTKEQKNLDWLPEFYCVSFTEKILDMILVIGQNQVKTYLLKWHVLGKVRGAQVALEKLFKPFGCSCMRIRYESNSNQRWCAT